MSSTETQLDLGRIQFEIFQDELEVLIENANTGDVYKYLTRDEGEKLLELLKRWLA